MERAMTARYRSDQEPLVSACLKRRENAFARLEQLGCRICADSVTNVMAMEKVDTLHGLPRIF